MSTSSSPRRIVTIFRIAAVLEALSWAGLLVGMFFKYVTKTTDEWVSIFGSIHGGLFLLYVVMALLVSTEMQWTKKTLFLALGAAIPPMFTLWFDAWAKRTGKFETGGDSPDM